jgi:hypothetical protein
LLKKRSWDDHRIASSSYAGSAGTRPRCDLSDENVLISTLLEQQSGPVIGHVLRGCMGALSPTASMRTYPQRADGHSSTPAACRQHSNSFDGLCEGHACFVLGNSVCSRSPRPPHLESVNLDPISGPDWRLHEAPALERAGGIWFSRLRRPLGTSDCTSRPQDPCHLERGRNPSRVNSRDIVQRTASGTDSPSGPSWARWAALGEFF